MSHSAETLLRPRPINLVPFFVLSVAGHVVLATMAMLFSWLHAGPRMDLDVKPIKASLVRLGKPRDEKLLPRKEEPPPSAAEEASSRPVAVEAAPAAVKVPSTSAADMTQSASRLKKDGAKEARKNLLAAFKKTGKAGNVEEPEGRADGDPAGNAAKAEGERYFALLETAVRRNYDVSNTISEAERRLLKAEVALWLGPRGELLDVSVSAPSGNALFDSAVLGAVKKASPFSPPPEHLRDALRRQGVAILFRAVD